MRFFRIGLIIDRLGLDNTGRFLLVDSVGFSVTCLNRFIGVSLLVDSLRRALSSSGGCWFSVSRFLQVVYGEQQTGRNSRQQHVR